MQVPNFLACPECRQSTLTWSEDLTAARAPFNARAGATCTDCGREYPFVDGVWVLWSDRVKMIQTESVPDNAPLSDRVKWANVKIYDDVSDDYGKHHDGTQPYAETQLFLKALADDFQSRPPPGRARVLVDVGCATGISLDIGSKAYAHVVGVDISLANLRTVARKGHIAVLGDAERLPLVTNSVDLITCFATLHHFPDPPEFIRAGHRCLRPGGVLLVACEPTRAAMKRGPLSELIWNARKPVYRLLARRSNRYHMHRSREQQKINDLAEINRVMGGFDPDELGDWARQAGFEERKIFYGIDPSGFQKYEVPNWKLFVLKLLSLQNPVLRSNWVNVTAIARKRTSGPQ